MRAIDRGAVVAFVVSSLLALATGEIFARLYFAGTISYDHEMWRYATEVKRPAADPAIGHVHRPGAQAQLMGVDVAINEHGLRDDPIGPGGLGVETRRIAFLGDSLTFGWGVEKEETFEHRLEQALAETDTGDEQVEVLNFGTGNYNTAQQVALFEARGLALDPDEAVLFVFINDAEPTPERSRWSWLGESRFVGFLWSRLKTLGSRFGEGRGWQDYYLGLYADEQPGWRTMRAALERLRDLCREHEIGLRIVLLPELHQLDPYPFEAIHTQIASEADHLGVPHLDVTPALQGVESPQALWVAPDDAHPNAEAHRLIAEATFPFLATPAPIPGAAPPDDGEGHGQTQELPTVDGTTTSKRADDV
ncbi:MAG: SGNH/GDSL hydrolase family protein [Acidobacteriota bacterium]